MAGVKGKSGGARPNSGGARPGAGRKPSAAPELRAELADGQDRDPLEFLALVQNDPSAPLKDRIRAAVAAAQYVHKKRGEGGKKEESDARAKKASGGKFATPASPLALVKKVG